MFLILCATGLAPGRGCPLGFCTPYCGIAMSVQAGCMSGGVGDAASSTGGF